jgi:hypothetical protein
MSRRWVVLPAAPHGLPEKEDRHAAPASAPRSGARATATRARRRGPERRTKPARRRLSPDVVGQPARHRRESSESSPVGSTAPRGRASHGSTQGRWGRRLIGTSRPQRSPKPPRNQRDLTRSRQTAPGWKLSICRSFVGDPRRTTLKIVVEFGSRHRRKYDVGLDRCTAEARAGARGVTNFGGAVALPRSRRAPTAPATLAARPERE